MAYYYRPVGRKQAPDVAMYNGQWNTTTTVHRSLAASNKTVSDGRSNRRAFEERFVGCIDSGDENISDVNVN